jgi:hypothetical protein
MSGMPRAHTLFDVRIAGIPLNIDMFHVEL